MGRYPGAVSYLFDTFAIFWAAAVAPFHTFTVHCLYFGPAPWRSFISFDMSSYFGPAPGRSFIFVRYMFILWAGGLAQLHMCRYFVHIVGRRLGAVSYLFHLGSIRWAGELAPFYICPIFVSILWASALAQFHILSIQFPYFGLAPWRRFIFVRCMLHILGRRHGAVS